MAQGRMLNKSVATDKALNTLSIEAHFLYMMTVPHLDRDGLILGDAPVLFATAVPRRPELAGRIDELVNEWINSGLVTAYEGNDGRILYFRGFRKNNPTMRYDREGGSQLPPPPGMLRTETGLVPDEGQSKSSETPEQVRSESGVSPEQVPVNVIEGNVIEGNGCSDHDEPVWWQAWKESFKREEGVNPNDRRNLQPSANTYGSDVLVKAIDYANKHKQTKYITIRYVESILEGWKADGKLDGNGSKPAATGPERSIYNGIVYERQNGKLVEVGKVVQ